MNSIIGQKLRELRENKGLTLVKVAELTGIDIGLLSKIERGERKISKENLANLSAIYDTLFEDLLLLWMGEKILYQMEDEQLGHRALEVAEQMMAYPPHKRADKNDMSEIARKQLLAFPSVKKAWLFGSLASGRTHALSDVDIAIETDATFSYFDLADLQNDLEKALGCKVDIGFADAMKNHVLEAVKNEWIQIYEKKPS
jgi:predicted nucleotidyltransferase/plasmid maintenance system antidote protein VapI